MERIKALSSGSFLVIWCICWFCVLLAMLAFSTSCFRPAVSVIPFLTLLCLLKLLHLFDF